MTPPIRTTVRTPYVARDEHYVRLPLGGDAAINLFFSARPALSTREQLVFSREGVGATLDLAGPHLTLRDPWFAAMLSPSIGVGVGASGVRLRTGAELLVAPLTHGASLSVIPFVQGGVSMSLTGSAPLAGYVNGGVTVYAGTPSSTESVHPGLSLSLGYDSESGFNVGVGLSLAWSSALTTARRGELFESAVDRR